MSIILMHFAMIVSLHTPTAVELSVWMFFLGCGQPISMSVWRNGTISLAVRKSAASLASAAEAMTNLMIGAMVRTVPLNLGMGSSSERDMWAPARLRNLVLLRKLASECAARTMWLARKEGSIIGIGCDVVKELVDGNHCVFGGCGLLQANGAEGDQELVVNRPGIIQE
jgi:hypothetical protein